MNQYTLEYLYWFGVLTFLLFLRLLIRHGYLCLSALRIQTELKEDKLLGEVKILCSEK